ncbi:conserved exported hypothetical protein [Candidatus Terasakiella magnetica]|nr:conserved exported hypothetical protein [Candidatus Terasakiella magnetica]
MGRCFSAAAAAALMLVSLGARAEGVEGKRQFAEFSFTPTAPELTAAKRWGAEHFAKGKAAGRPVTPVVARAGATILISLESVAVCDRVKACPLLVFRDITAKPILKTYAFQNLAVEYREKDTYLILRRWDEVTECKISNTQKALCRKSPPPKTG